MNREINILLRHGYMTMPRGKSEDKSLNHLASIATISSNLSYYGFALNEKGFNNLRALDSRQLEEWWTLVEPEIKEITGASKNMGDFVVYKNFPQEVIDKSEAEYWINQIMMYWGFVKPRKVMSEVPTPKVLQMANPLTLESILKSYLVLPNRWKNQELQDVIYLVENYDVDFSKVAFKENLINLAKFFIEKNRKIKIKTATDVLRLAVGLSDGDISLREKSKFKRFSRKERKFFLEMLENSPNLEDDVARRKEIWKRFLFFLHAGDYGKRFQNVKLVMNRLYNKQVYSFNSKVETRIANKDNSVFSMLKSRPGEFRRRLIHLLDVFGEETVREFTDHNVLKQLTNAQLVSIRKILEAANNRNTRVFPPKGNWNKLQIAEPRKVNRNFVKIISTEIGRELNRRLFTENKWFLDPATEMIKLPSNDGEVSPYARGTEFPIPKGINFIRTASYWQAKEFGNTWFDNGWNFFDKNWKTKGAICWCDNAQGFGKEKAALFSGDPCSNKTKDNKACQVIDLYLDKLEEMGIRYAVWNILCYSMVPFSKADEVFAALQWGEDAKAGQLFEPSRAQLAFPLNGDQLTKFVCYIDIKERKMVYMDANLKGNVSSASSNCSILTETMPAFVDYLKSLPSIYDLFKDSSSTEGERYILYSDKNIDLKDVKAYVFKPENNENIYHNVDIADIMSMKG